MTKNDTLLSIVPIFFSSFFKLFLLSSKLKMSPLRISHYFSLSFFLVLDNNNNRIFFLVSSTSERWKWKWKKNRLKSFEDHHYSCMMTAISVWLLSLKNLNFHFFYCGFLDLENRFFFLNKFIWSHHHRFLIQKRQQTKNVSCDRLNICIFFLSSCIVDPFHFIYGNNDDDKIFNKKKWKWKQNWSYHFADNGPLMKTFDGHLDR